MKRILYYLILALTFCTVMALASGAGAQTADINTFKYRVDTSITNKTAVASISRVSVADRFKELADMLYGRTDTLNKLATRSYTRSYVASQIAAIPINTLFYDYLASLPGFASGRVLTVQGTALIWAAAVAAAAGDFNINFNNDFSH